MEVDGAGSPQQAPLFMPVLVMHSPETVSIFAKLRIALEEPALENATVIAKGLRAQQTIARKIPVHLAQPPK